MTMGLNLSSDDDEQGNGKRPRTECQVHAEQQAQLDNLTSDVRNIASDQRASNAWQSKQDEVNGRILGELGTTRAASMRAADAAVKAVGIVDKLDKKWDRKHDELVGRVAVLEQQGNPPSVEPEPDGLPDYDDIDAMMSEGTKNDLLAANKEVVLSTFLREREMTSKLRAELAALQARIDEKDRHSQRAQANVQRSRAWTFGWGKLLVTAFVSLAGGGGAAIVIREILGK